MRTRLGLMAIATALVLSACGSSGSSDATASSEPAATDTASAPAATAQWDVAQDMGNGISVTVSAPATFKPGDFASNYLPGQVANLMTVDVKNGGSAAFDMAGVSLLPASNCTDVLDGDNGINGAPTDPVAAGGSVEFKYAVACDGKVGDPLTISITVGAKTVDFAGKLA